MIIMYVCVLVLTFVLLFFYLELHLFDSRREAFPCKASTLCKLSLEFFCFVLRAMAYRKLGSKYELWRLGYYKLLESLVCLCWRHLIKLSDTVHCARPHPGVGIP